MGELRGSRVRRWAPAAASLTPNPDYRLTRGFASTEHLAAEAIVAYVDGVLGTTARTRADAHLTECAWCVAEITAQTDARSALRGSNAEVPVPPGLLGQLSQIPTREIDLRAMTDRHGSLHREKRDI